jgi:SHS2 domain-containing protein
VGASPGRGHRQIEHTADLALEIWAPSEEALLEEAARAVVGILTDGATLGSGQEHAVELETLDPPDRLVRFLNEILYLATVEGFLCVSASLELRPGGLRGTLFGEGGAFDRLTTEIKSATYHDLRLLRRTDGTYGARVVMDV